MIVKKLQEVEQVQEKEKVMKRVVIGEEDGAPNYIMRVFDIEPGGSTNYHTHDSEHEVFVLSGQGAAVREDGETPIARDSIAFVPPNEVHCFKNTGDETLRVI